MSKHGSWNRIFRMVVSLGLIAVSIWLHPVAASLAFLSASALFFSRVRPPATREVEDRPDDNHLRQIQFEAMQQRAAITEEALDLVRADMLGLATVAELVPSDRAGDAIARLAALTAITAAESANCLLGEVLVESLGEIAPGSWVVEAQLPAIWAPPRLVSAMVEGVVDAASGAIGDVRCSGALDGGMALLQISLVSAVAIESHVGFHVAQRAASLLGGILWCRRRGALEEILIAVPQRHTPGLRPTSRAGLDFDLMARP